MEFSMQYISQKISSKEIEAIFNLPLDFKNRELEVLIFPVYQKVADNPKNDSMYGILNSSSNLDLIELEPHAWREAIMKKYGNS